VRTVQPILEDFDPELEDAAASLGANRWQVFWRVIFPTLTPALLTGFALAFARALGEYGSVVFISSNIPMKTQIVPLLIMNELDGFQYAKATALAVVMLVISFFDFARRQRAAMVEQSLQHKQPRMTAAGKINAPHRRTEPPFVRWLLIAIALAFIALFLVLPLVSVFTEGLRQGLGFYFQTLRDPLTLSAIKLTLIAAGFPCRSTAFSAWRRRGPSPSSIFAAKTFLLTLIDLPFSISPVISGLIYVLVFGAQGWFGSWFSDHNIKIIFAVPGIVLATIFVTFPFVARELIPLMQAQGRNEEEAARVLGASGWQTFWRVTIPNIKWGLLYGVILCNARAMGEFGAVSVVSGHIQGQTNTIPLHVQILYESDNFAGAFAVASLLTFLALVTLVLKTWVEYRNTELRGTAFAPVPIGKKQ